MTYKIVLRPLAKKDIKGIWHYSYNNWGEKQADKYANELALAIKNLADNPNMGIAIDTIRKGYRIHAFKQHLVIYRLLPSTVEVVRILGKTMDTRRHI